MCRPALDEVSQVQYEISDEEYGGKAGEDTWVQALLAHLGHHLNTLQPLLTPSNFEHLITQLLEKVNSCELTSVADQPVRLCVFTYITKTAALLEEAPGIDACKLPQAVIGCNHVLTPDISRTCRSLTDWRPP